MKEHQSGQPLSSGGQPGDGGNEAFIPAGERPKLEFNPDQPIGELTVRDLQQIITGVIMQHGSKLLSKSENENPQQTKIDKDITQEQPGSGPGGGSASGGINQITGRLSQMAVNQMALSQEVAALRAEVEKLKGLKL